MLSLIDFFSAHAPQAHWFILIGLLLAGCNFPISIDVLVIIAALFSAEFVPENTILLYEILPKDAQYTFLPNTDTLCCRSSCRGHHAFY